MQRISYKELRPFLFWSLLSVAFITVGIFIYKELTAPLKTPPEVINIATNAPQQAAPPTDETKATHTVPPNHPKDLLIPKINLYANIFGVGVNDEGAIAAPQTAWDVGWFKEGALPGSGSGTALIDGHVNDAFNTPGVFAELTLLAKDDEITIVRGDNSKLNYKVVSVEQMPLQNIDMKRLLGLSDPHKEGLTLVTCGGKYEASTGSYSDRVVVFAQRS